MRVYNGRKGGKSARISDAGERRIRNGDQGGEIDLAAAHGGDLNAVRLTRGKPLKSDLFRCILRPCFVNLHIVIYIKI